jgi:hypothetical protein
MHSVLKDWAGKTALRVVTSRSRVSPPFAGTGKAAAKMVARDRPETASQNRAK